MLCFVRDDRLWDCCNVVIYDRSKCFCWGGFACESLLQLLDLSKGVTVGFVKTLSLKFIALND